MMNVPAKFALLSLPFILLSALLFVLDIGCTEDATGPENHPPVIDSILLDPQAINPGAEVTLTAFAGDPDNDPVSYCWSTYYMAGFFTDSTAPVCTMLVNQVLEGGMKVKVTLTVSDGKDITSKDIWLPLVEGETVYGRVYFKHTQIPIPNVEVTIRKLIDTTGFRGEYTLRHVPPGMRTIHAYSNTCPEFIDSFEVNDTVEFDMYLECPGVTTDWSGLVKTSEGEILSNIIVTIHNRDSTATVLADTTDITGAFTIEGAPLGNRVVSIREIDNPDFDILADTFNLNIVAGSAAEITGLVKYMIYSSIGVTSPEDWVLDNSGEWDSWVVDDVNGCYYYNSCVIAGFGELAMAAPIMIPENAQLMGWYCELDLEEAICFIIYDFDGNRTDGYSFMVGTGQYQVEEPIQNPPVAPYGKPFTASFVATNVNQGVCATACLKRFDIFIYR